MPDHYEKDTEKGLTRRSFAVGAAVALAESRKKRISELDLGELRSVHAGFGEDVKDVFDLKKALSQRSITGAPGPTEIRKQLARWLKTKP